VKPKLAALVKGADIVRAELDVRAGRK
jgi:hypothetical protein